MEIYLDVLILENIVMNYLIMLVTGLFSRTRTTSLRMLAGSLVGAAYVVVLITCPGMKVYYTMLAKLALSFMIVAIAFPIDKISTFFKTLIVFYISTFIFAGASFAFIYFNQDGGFIRNGIVYVFWQSKWTVLILSITTAGIIVKAFWEVMQYRLMKDKLLVPLQIAFGEQRVGMPALVDTGNSLHDPLTNTPVIVVEFKAIEEILPAEIKNIFEESRENDLDSVTNIVSNSQWFSRFRVIPFTSLGKENGMLIGFKPDYIEVGENQKKKGVSNVIIGIYNRTLSKNEKYRALLSPELVA